MSTLALPRITLRQRGLGIAALITPALAEVTPPEETPEQKEIAQLKAQVAKLEAALSYYRASAAKPLREVDALAWYKAKICGAAQDNPMAVIATMEGQIVAGKVIATQPTLRA